MKGKPTVCSLMVTFTFYFPWSKVEYSHVVFLCSCFWHTSKTHFLFSLSVSAVSISLGVGVATSGSVHPLCPVTQLLRRKTEQEKVVFDISSALCFSLWFFARNVSIFLLHCLRWREDRAVCTPSLSPVTTARVQPSPTPSSSETRVCWWVSTLKVCSD